MASQKVTKMVVDVDLNCSDCYIKVKKVISKIPEIRDQEYDVEKNKVKITVVSCCPDKIRDKLRHKGGGSIQKIQIVEAEKSKPKPAAEKPAKDPDQKPKEADEKPKPAAKVGEVPKMVLHGYPQMYPQRYPYPMVGYGYGYEGMQVPHGHSHGYGMGPPQPLGYGYGYGYGYDYGYNNSRYNRGNDYFSEENPQGCSVM